MKRKVLSLAGIVLVLALVLWSWEKNAGKFREHSLEITGRDYGELVYLDGKILVYADSEKDDSELRLVQVDTETGEEREMGTMPSFGPSSGDGAVFDGKYYTCYTNGKVIESEEGNWMAGVLYEFDPKRCVAAPVASDRNLSLASWLCAAPNGILQLMTPWADSGEQTCFNLYCPDTGENRTVLTGSEADIFCQSAMEENLLYVLSSHYRDPNRSSMLTMQVFETENYRMVDEINLDAVEPMLRAARVGDMEVCGDYVYFSNWYDQSVIAKISDGAVTPILERDSPWLRCAQWFNRPEQTKQMLFYVQGEEEEAECIVLNADTGELRSFKPKLRDGYDLCRIQIDGDSVMLYSAKESFFTGKYYYEFLDFYDFEDFIRQGDGAAVIPTSQTLSPPPIEAIYDE